MTAPCHNAFATTKATFGANARKYAQTLQVAPAMTTSSWSLQPLPKGEYQPNGYARDAEGIKTLLNVSSNISKMVTVEMERARSQYGVENAHENYSTA